MIVILKHKRQGSIIVLAMIYIVVLGIIGLAATQFGIHSRRIAMRNSIYTDELAAAEYSINKLYAELDFLSRFLPPGLEEFDQALSSVQLPQLPGFQITANPPIENLGFFTGDPTGEFNSPLVFNYKYRLRARAYSTSAVSQRFTHPGVEVAQIIYVQYIPLNIFGIFSNLLWEIIPGPRYDLFGKVHSNQNLVFDAHTGAYYHDYITVAGNILGGAQHVPGREPAQKKVYITNGVNTLPMYENGYWIDHTYPNWKEVAEQRWNGYVRDSAHGVQPIELSLPWTEDPHALIERISPDDTLSEQHIKFEWLAGLRILRMPDGTIKGFAKNAGDTDWREVALTYPDPADPQRTKTPYTTGLQFYDNREGSYIRILEIDVQNLQEYTAYLDNYYGIEFNGILYVSEEPAPSYKPAVRVTNGSRIPSSGLVIATDDPLYVKGNYNLDRYFALLAGDAINILSNSWSDALNNTPGHPTQNASNTTTNAVFIGGITPSSDQYQFPYSYSGGAENYFRYLENWSGRTHTFYGSIICMFSSQVAIGRWYYGGNRYYAPNRNWHWNALGSTIPPSGLPYVRRLLKSEWSILPQ